MKKIICLLAVFCFSHALFAQNSSMTHKDMAKMKDCVYMKDGKMMEMMDGKTMMMDKDMTMKNGTMVMTDGSVKMKDGSAKTMKDGQCVDMNGKMTMMKKEDMKMMMHDSTNSQQ